MIQGAGLETKGAAADTTDSLGCPLSSLHMSQEIRSGGIAFYRKRHVQTGISNVATPATDRGFLVGVAVQTHQRRIFHAHHSTTHDFAENAIYVRNFADDYRADLRGPFDFLLLEIGQSALDRVAEESGGAVCEGLKSIAGESDEVLANLVRALAPALERRQETNTLFIDHIGLAIGAHLVDHYGGLRRPIASGVRLMSRAREKKAKEFLRARLDGNVQIGDVAAACGMSHSYFTRAFKHATGKTPHQWLLETRVEHARDLMLQSALTLAEVALATGFSDQSHFTRVFTRIMGVTPGRWLRNVRL